MAKFTSIASALLASAISLSGAAHGQEAEGHTAKPNGQGQDAENTSKCVDVHQFNVGGMTFGGGLACPEFEVKGEQKEPSDASKHPPESQTGKTRPLKDLVP